MLTFSKLKVGQQFRFASEARYTSLAHGPWIKVSPRRYKHVEGGPIHTVGSQIVEVVKEDAPNATV